MSTKTLQDRNDVWGAMKALMTSASTENRSMSAEEIGKYDELETKLQAFDKQLEREQRFEALETKINTPVEKRVVATATKNDTAVLASDEYRSAFFNYVRDGREEHMNEFRSLYEGSVAQGGYTIPTILDKTLVTTLLAQNIIRNIGAKVLATTSTTDLPVLSAAATVSNAAEYPTGSNPISASDPTFNKCTLKAYKIAGLLQVSNELLNDSGVDLEGYLGFELGTVVANQEEVNFITGSGVNSSLGLFNITNVAGQTIGTSAVSGSTAGASGSVLLDSVLDGFYSMKPQHRKAAVYVVGDALVSRMRKAKDNLGRYLWDNTVVVGQPDTFNGVPVYVSSAAPATYQVGSCVGILVDPRYLTIGDRGATTFMRLNERFADQDQTGFRITKRSDIQITKADAIKQLIAG